LSLSCAPAFAPIVLSSSAMRPKFSFSDTEPASFGPGSVNRVSELGYFASAMSILSRFLEGVELSDLWQYAEQIRHAVSSYFDWLVAHKARHALQPLDVSRAPPIQLLIIKMFQTKYFTALDFWIAVPRMRSLVTPQFQQLLFLVARTLNLICRLQYPSPPRLNCVDCRNLAKAYLHFCSAHF